MASYRLRELYAIIFGWSIVILLMVSAEILFH